MYKGKNDNRLGLFGGSQISKVPISLLDESVPCHSNHTVRLHVVDCTKF